MAASKWAFPGGDFFTPKRWPEKLPPYKLIRSPGAKQKWLPPKNSQVSEMPSSSSSRFGSLERIFVAQDSPIFHTRYRRRNTQCVCRHTFEINLNLCFLHENQLFLLDRLNSPITCCSHVVWNLYLWSRRCVKTVNMRLFFLSLFVGWSLVIFRNKKHLHPFLFGVTEKVLRKSDAGHWHTAGGGGISWGQPSTWSCGCIDPRIT